MFENVLGTVSCSATTLSPPLQPQTLLSAISDFARARIRQPRGVWRSSDLFWTAFSMHFSAVLHAFLWEGTQLVFFFFVDEKKNIVDIWSCYICIDQLLRSSGHQRRPQNSLSLPRNCNFCPPLCYPPERRRGPPFSLWEGDLGYDFSATMANFDTGLGRRDTWWIVCVSPLAPARKKGCAAE